MKVTKDLKTNKGITLIALVITIIVMIILVAVTITIAVNGGLFDYTGRAAKGTNSAIDEEQLLASGKIYRDGVWYDSIEDYLAGKPSGMTNPNYFTYTFYDSTKVASNTKTKTSATKTATITGINPEYWPEGGHYGGYYGGYYGSGGGNPTYIQDGDEKITDIILPSEVMYDGEIYKVTSIGECAFRHCRFSSIVIPEGIIDIGYRAFEGVPITDITIPSSMTSIDTCAFSDCKYLVNLTIEKNGSDLSIGWGAFQDCYSLKTIIIPLRVIEIDTNGFDTMSNPDIYCEVSSRPSGWDSYIEGDGGSRIDEWYGDSVSATVHWGSTGPNN